MIKNPARDIGESVQLSHIEDTPQNRCMLCEKTQADVGGSKVHLNLFSVDLRECRGSAHQSGTSHGLLGPLPEKDLCENCCRMVSG